MWDLQLFTIIMKYELLHMNVIITKDKQLVKHVIEYMTDSIIILIIDQTSYVHTHTH